MPFRDWIKRLMGARSPMAREPQTLRTSVEETDACDPFDPFPEPVRIEISDVFDLHSIAPRDAKRVVEEYLREAHRAGFLSVRIIHGKGAGVQREMVRAVLKRTPFVAGWTDAPPVAGGWGATVVHLSSRDEADPREL
jgi:dsDNA-specific endonuclease/ATPase MutS2